jgi:putative N6-adenine-specific DNA methylase
MQAPGHLKFVATTLAGLESVCAAELTAIGALEVLPLRRAVSFSGPRSLMYRANYEVRTALRILMPLGEIAFSELNEFHLKLMKVPWEQWFTHERTIAVEAVGNHPCFTNTLFAAQKCKDAIADRFRNKFSIRPSVDLDDPDVRIHVYLNATGATVSLDSSGDPLFKRGYRKGSVPAPLNEVLAAGMVMLSGWDASTPFYDPFCGSGTIPIEAALIASRVPPGKFRERWSFMNWLGFDAELWESVKSEAQSHEVKPAVSINASDMDARSLTITRRNISAAGCGDIIKTELSLFEEFQFPPAPGLIVTNPPYGERLREFDQVSFYKKVGDVLKRNCPGYHAWLIGSDLHAIKFIGLKPEQKIILYNGQLECRFLHFSLFAGSRKDRLTNS